MSRRRGPICQLRRIHSLGGVIDIGNQVDSTFVRAHFKWTAVSLFHRGMPVIHKYLFIDMSNKNTGIVISYHVKLKLTIQSTENVSYIPIF